MTEARRRLLKAAAVTAVAAVLSWWALIALDAHRLAIPIAAIEAPTVILIEPGSSLGAIARQLADADLLEHPESWIREARRRGIDTQLRAGEYEIGPGATPTELLDRLVSGEVVLHQLTLLEGWNLRQTLEAIRLHPAITQTLPASLAPADLARRLELPVSHPEGMFFPDTYRFQRGTTDRAVLQQAAERLEEQLSRAWSERIDGLPLRTPYEALILASIVEKETGAAEERGLISGVFINRLRRGMRLQTDPTVIYGLGPSFDGNLTRAHLNQDGPYNTYRRAGLPPTPIALAGWESLRAATQPTPTPYIFFVATGIGDGRHYFAQTLAEHNRNVARHVAAVRGAREGR